MNGFRLYFYQVSEQVLDRKKFCKSRESLFIVHFNLTKFLANIFKILTLLPPSKTLMKRFVKV